MLFLQHDLRHEAALDAIALQLQAILVAFSAAKAEGFPAVGVLDGQLVTCEEQGAGS